MGALDIDRIDPANARHGVPQRLLDAGAQRHRTHGARPAGTQKLKLDHHVPGDLAQPDRPAIRIEVRPNGVQTVLYPPPQRFVLMGVVANFSHRERWQLPIGTQFRA